MNKSQEFIINKYFIKARQCRKSDYPFVFGIIRTMIFPFVKAYFTPSKKMFDERFTKDYKERRILIIGKRRIGFYQLTPEGNNLDITGIFLVKRYQGKGIGNYLMNYFETLGYATLTLQVWDNNPAYYFYKKIGYKVVLKKNHKYFMKKKVKKII